jgi:hypothetical protein
MGGGASGKDDTSSSSEDDEDYKEKVRAFCAQTVDAVRNAAPPILKSAIRAWGIEKKVLEKHKGDKIFFTVQLGYGEDVMLLDGDSDSPFSLPPSGEVPIEEHLYNYFFGRNFAQVVHEWHCNMGDGGRDMCNLLQNMCVKMGVVVREGKVIEIQPPVVIFTSEDAFASDCMDDEERDKRRRLKAKMTRKFEREREEERAAKQQKTIVINQRGELIGELTSLERAIYQNGCSTCNPHTTKYCSGCVSLRKKGLLLLLLYKMVR